MGAGISGGEPPWDHEVGGRAQGGGRALDPRGQVLAPPDVFLVTSRKRAYCPGS